MKVYGTYTTTENLTSCAIKLAVLAFTLFVSIMCALGPQSSESFSANSFYITVLLQSVNTLYDMGAFLAKNEDQATKKLKIRVVSILGTQLLILLASIAYLLFHVMLVGNVVIMIVVIVLTAMPLFLLVWEVYLHIMLK